MSFERPDHDEQPESPEQRSAQKEVSALGNGAAARSEQLRSDALATLDTEHQTPAVKEGLNKAQQEYLKEVSGIEKSGKTGEELRTALGEAEARYKDTLGALVSATQGAEAKQGEDKLRADKEKWDADKKRVSESGAPQTNSGNDGMLVHADYSQQNAPVEHGSPSQRSAGAEGGASGESPSEVLERWPA